MDNKNYWTDFCDDMNQSVNDVKKHFDKQELSFVDNASQIKLDDKSEEQLIEMKNYAADLAGDGKKEELRNKIEELLECIRERDKKIIQLKKDADDNKTELGNWYNKAKHDCEELCAKLEKYTSEKLGIISLFADILKVVIDKDGFYMEKAKTTIKEKICTRKRSSFWSVFADAILLLFALALMLILFLMIGTDKVPFGIQPTGLGKWIAGIFILVFLVGAVFLIIRIYSLKKNSNLEIQGLQSLLDKMGSRIMTKDEIDRELERIQDAVKK